MRETGEQIADKTGNHIWVERYERELMDMCDLQDGIQLAKVVAAEPKKMRRFMTVMLGEKYKLCTPLKAGCVLPPFGHASTYVFAVSKWRGRTNLSAYHGMQRVQEY